MTDADSIMADADSMMALQRHTLQDTATTLLCLSTRSFCIIPSVTSTSICMRTRTSIRPTTYSNMGIRNLTDFTEKAPLIPENSPNRKTRFPRYTAKLDQNLNLNLYREILRNLSASIWWECGEVSACIGGEVVASVEWLQWNVR